MAHLCLLSCFHKNEFTLGWNDFWYHSLVNYSPKSPLEQFFLGWIFSTFLFYLGGGQHFIWALEIFFLYLISGLFLISFSFALFVCFLFLFLLNMTLYYVHTYSNINAQSIVFGYFIYLLIYWNIFSHYKQ